MAKLKIVLLVFLADLRIWLVVRNFNLCSNLVIPTYVEFRPSNIFLKVILGTIWSQEMQSHSLSILSCHLWGEFRIVGQMLPKTTHSVSAPSWKPFFIGNLLNSSRCVCSGCAYASMIWIEFHRCWDSEVLRNALQPARHLISLPSRPQVSQQHLANMNLVFTCVRLKSLWPHWILDTCLYQSGALGKGPIL